MYIYLLKVPSFHSRYFNKIKGTSRLGRLLALSLEILTANGFVTKCKMTCQIFAGNEISFKIKSFVVSVLYM